MGIDVKFAMLSTAVILLLAACTAEFASISGTPTADLVLSRARQVASKLDSYKAERTTVTTTVYPGNRSRNTSETRFQDFEIGSRSSYRIDQSGFEYQFIRLNNTTYSRSQSGQWDVGEFKPHDEDFLLPGEQLLPPAHPLEWVHRRVLSNTNFLGTELLNGMTVFVVAGQISILPTPVPPNSNLPADNVRVFVDSESFQVMRIEIDQNILDSLREDSGYQVIPGIVEIETLDIYDYSNHNEVIEIDTPLVDADA